MRTVNDDQVPVRPAAAVLDGAVECCVGKAPRAHISLAGECRTYARGFLLLNTHPPRNDRVSRPIPSAVVLEDTHGRACAGLAPVATGDRLHRAACGLPLRAANWIER